MSSQPFFSICIPTHNRINTLRQAVATILAQDFLDYEILVSDNGSVPSAETALSEFQDARIRYFRHDPLIDANDNWEFALQHAKGAFVLLLADDDGLIPSALGRVAAYIDKENAEVVQVGHIRYSHPYNTGSAAKNVNSLLEHEFTGKESVYEPASLLRDILIGWNIFSGRPTYSRFPEMHPSGCFMARHLLEKVLRKNGRITSPPFADVGFLNVILQAKLFHFLDLPLSLIGVDTNREINGPLKGRRRYYDTLKSACSCVPFKARTFTSLAVEAHLLVLKANSDLFPVIPAHLGERFYVAHYFELIEDSVRDRRTISDLKEFFGVVLRLPPGLMSKVILRCLILPFYRPFKRMCVKSLSAFISTDQLAEPRWLSGGQNGFHDLKTCAAFVERKYLTNPLSALPVKRGGPLYA